MKQGLGKLKVIYTSCGVGTLWANGGKTLLILGTILG
jgi:hypothetical protein